MPFLNQRKGENDRRKYFKINLHERMLRTSAGVEPATSWSPVGRRIQLSHRGRQSTIFDLITAHAPITSSNSVVFRSQPVYFFVYYFIKAYVVGTHLNYIDLSTKRKIRKKTKKKKTLHQHHLISISLIFVQRVPLI